MTRPTLSSQIPENLLRATRTAMIVSAIIGIVLGIIALIWPGPTLLVVAVVFGVALLFTGVFRLVLAFSASAAPGGVRLLYGVLGAFILIIGVVCLFDPVNALVFLGIVIGVAWIFDGISTLTHLRSGYHHAPRWLLILGGVVSVLAGIVALILPAFTVVVFLKVAAVLLIAISVVALFSLPKAVAARGPATGR